MIGKTANNGCFKNGICLCIVIDSMDVVAYTSGNLLLLMALESRDKVCF